MWSLRIQDLAHYPSLDISRDHPAHQTLNPPRRLDSLCGATESHVWQKRDVWGRPVAHVVAFPQWGSWLLVAQNGSELKICVLSRINSIIYFKNLWAHLSATLFLPPVFFQQKNAVLKATGEPQESHGPKSHITFLPHVAPRGSTQTVYFRPQSSAFRIA